MKLELNEKEVATILLDYAEQKWPGQFNVITGTGYRSITGVLLTHEAPEKPEPAKQA